VSEFPLESPLAPDDHSVTAPRSVLLVQDNPADVFATGRILGDAFEPRPSIVSVATVAEACARLRESGVDLVLLDLGPPGTPGIESCARLLHEAPGTPIVLLAELANLAEAEAAVTLGAHDYVIKGRYTAAVLGRAIRYALERHRLQARLDEMSLTDGLTGLTNRRGFTMRAEDDIRRTRRTGTPLLLALADVDGLTDINTIHGRLEGDRALRDAAGVLRSTFRDSDVLARVGGDEFGLLFRDAGPECPDQARRRLQRRLDEHNGRTDRRWQLRIRLAFPGERSGPESAVDALLAALRRRGPGETHAE
jgi:diguanylate cyclase (GGDEF)-like protein